MRLLRSTGVGLVLAVAGCAATPDAPLPEPPARYTAAPTAEAEPSAEGDWVAQLGAPGLSAVVDEALAGNPDLAQAQARAESARARARAAVGRWLPDLDVSFGASRTGTPTGAGDRVQTEAVTSQITTSWEADVWGRVLDRTRAAGLDAEAARQDFEAARLSVAGAAARAWIDVIEADLLVRLAEEDLATRRQVLETTERRYAQGLVGSLALRTARSQTASAEAQLSARLEGRREAARRMETLLGRYPDATFAASPELPQLAPLTAPGAPADLLARRPDVAAAEARLEAAGFRVSEARKALLPRLTLSASASGSGAGLADVTDVDGLVTRLIGNLAAPLFQGGALRAEARVAAADARGAAAAYVEAALRAWQEVESALSQDQSLAVQEERFAAAADEAREAQALAEREYARGLATIFDLIDAYSRRIEAERALIQVRAQRASNRIDYHVALGAALRRSSASEGHSS